MKVFYSISIWMDESSEMTGEILESASRIIGFGKPDIDDARENCLTATFSSNVKPTDMRSRAKSLLAEFPDINFVDVIYRFEYEMVPDRFVAWFDGKMTEFTGHITFEKEN